MPEIRDPDTYAVIGAAMEVHRHLGDGYSEPVYQEALAVELELRGVPFVAQPSVRVVYKGRILESWFKPDLVCFDRVLVEIKALSSVGPREDSQVINYLKVTGHEKALLINFGEPQLDYKRLVLSRRP